MNTVPVVGTQSSPAPTAAKDGLKKKEADQKPYKPKTNGNYTVDGKITVADIALAIVLGPLLLGGCSSAKTKETYELNEAEQGALDHLLMTAYSEELKLRKYSPFIETTIRSLPKSDKLLDHPIRTIGAVTTNISMMGQDLKTKQALDEAMANKYVSWEENGNKKTLKITKWVIGLDSNNAMGYESFGGSMMGMFRDVVTIYPLKVSIETK